MTRADELRVITFNDILRAGGIEGDVTRVKLLRHIETRNRIDVHDVWRNQREVFEAWQARQWDNFFKGVAYVASFVVSRSGETVFVGLYSVDGGWAKVVAGTPDPLTGTPADPRLVQHELTRVADFDVYAGRLVVQWFRAGEAPAGGSGQIAIPSRCWRSPPSRRHPSPADLRSGIRLTSWTICLLAGGRRCVRRRGSTC